MDKFYTHTLGCKVNQAETDEISGKLVKKGLKQVGMNQSPDWCIINTCTVTSHTDKKVRQAIRKIKKACPRAMLVVTGCFAELNREFLEKEGAHLVVANRDKMDIGNLVQAKKDCKSIPGGMHSRPMVKVQDGCQQFCSYCIVPLVRGGYRSVAPQQAVNMVKQAAGSGYQEAVITGIHLGRYGIDLAGDYGLEDLIEDILAKTDIKRIRLSSIEIGEVTDGLLNLMAGSGSRICDHLHIPLQSGSNRILESMGRPYSREYFFNRIARITEIMPSVSITTDLMVGFPGEGEDDFMQTMEAARKASFSKLHVFKYSRRKKTAAAGMGGHVPEELKKARSRQLVMLGEELRGRYLAKNTGKALQVVLERRDLDLCTGMSGNYIKVFFKPAGGLRKGRIYEVFTESMYANGLWGKIYGT
ncbi:MAG: tRNA (N(6)-L-threonylcarbamoyladenosine(37)-C(2))-methylthiotransferase MtaB [Actinomycetota bacterium]